MQNFPLGPIQEQDFFGYNDATPPELLPRGVFTKMENALCSDKKIEKVFGISAVAPSIAAYSFNGAFPYENIATSVKQQIVSINGASNAQLYKWTGTGSFSAIGSANLTNSLPVNFELAANYLIGLNGTEVIDYDGTTVTKNRAGIPIGFTGTWFHNYYFNANTASYPNRVYWSDLANPIAYTVTNYVDINPGDGDSIQGFGKIQDELLCFKRNTIWSITGFSGASFSATTIATQNTNARIFGYGCVAPRSIISVGNDIYFLSFFGNIPHFRSLRKTQYATTLGGGLISQDIEGTMQSLNTNVLNNTVGTFDGRYVYWAVSTGGATANNYILGFDTLNIKKIQGKTVYPWFTMNGKNISSMFLSTISGKNKIYGTHSGTNGKVYLFDTSIHSDDGAPITIDVRKTYMHEMARKQKWRYLYNRYDTGVAATLNINARCDGSTTYVHQKSISLLSTSPGLGPTGTFTLGVSTLGGNLYGRKRTDFTNMIGATIDIQFTETSTFPIRLYEYEIYSHPKALRAG